MKLTRKALFALVIAGISMQAQADLISKLTTSMPVIDGVVSAKEWNQAGSTPDSGLAGSTYAMWRSGLTYSSGADSWTYSGTFAFLLHNIEQNKDEGNIDQGGNVTSAFNVFDIYSASDSTKRLLEVTISYDGFAVVKFAADGSTVEGSKAFKYVPGSAPSETSTYSWDEYWGVYARGGYGNSAYTSGLAGAVDDNNQIFELVYLMPSTDIGTDTIPLPVQRSLKDPDQRNPPLPNMPWDTPTYIDVTVTSVPEPATMALLGIGGGILMMNRRKYKCVQ